jgi:hypothetical protein
MQSLTKLILTHITERAQYRRKFFDQKFRRYRKIRRFWHIRRYGNKNKKICSENKKPVGV